MSEKNPTEALAPFAAMFGFVPAETVASDEQATLQYGQKKVVIDPANFVNVAQAFGDNKDDLSLDDTGFVNYSRDGNVIAADQPVEAGAYYIATTRHDDKG